MMPTEELCGLAGEGTGFCMAVYVDDLLKNHSLFRFESKMEVTGVLLATPEGTVLWRDKGIGSDGSGGILAAAIDAAVFSNDAIDKALRSLFSTLPTRVIQ